MGEREERESARENIYKPPRVVLVPFDGRVSPLRPSSRREFLNRQSKEKMRDTKRPHLHTSGDHRPTIALAAVTGQALRLAASGVGGLRMDWGQGTLVGAKGDSLATTKQLVDSLADEVGKELEGELFEEGADGGDDEEDLVSGAACV